MLKLNDQPASNFPSCSLLLPLLLPLGWKVQPSRSCCSNSQLYSNFLQNRVRQAERGRQREREGERRRVLGRGQREKFGMSCRSRFQKKQTVCDDVDESVPQQVEKPKIQMASQNNLLISLGIGPVLVESKHDLLLTWFRHMMIIEASCVSSEEFPLISPACLTEEKPNLLFTI